MLGPLWPTSLAIAPAALAARAAGTMPGGYCRNSGTWGSPDDAKVEPPPLVPLEDQQDTKPRPEMGRPISARRCEQRNRTPEGEWVASGSNLSPGRRRDKEASGFRGPAGGRAALEGLARIEEDKNANVGARR